MRLTELRAALAAALILAGGLAAAQGYAIADLRFEVDGRSREYRLAEASEIEVGKTFDSLEELEAYLAEKRQLLINERVLETVEIETTVGAAAPGLPSPVSLLVRVKDSWNLILLPYFKYDSNDGLLLAGRGRDYNFLGTMTPLYLDLNWLIDTGGESFPSAELGFDIPFKAAGLDWKWSVGAAVTFVEGGPADIYLGNGVNLYLPAGPGTLGLLLTESVYFGDRDSSGAYYDDSFYAKAEAKLSWAVTLAEFGKRGKLVATPHLSAYGRIAPGGLVDPSLNTGIVVDPGFDLAYGRFDWIGNFRRGLKASLGGDLAWYTGTGRVTRTFDLSVAGYGILGRVGPSARLTGFYKPDGVDTSAGEALRGILDARVDTDAALFLNLDLPVKLIVFKPADWFGVSWMRYFHFEQQWSPFLDLALGHIDGTWFHPASGWYSGGLEVITYPAVARSFYVRISAGFDLAAVLENRSLSAASARDGQPIRELFFGLGHLY